ncbi:hypothetical protein MMC07_002631 [Pseudocyphellaria aurata]|nr:hypothetical protein [Pseudocyphellaria aurata]
MPAGMTGPPVQISQCQLRGAARTSASSVVTIAKRQLQAVLYQLMHRASSGRETLLPYSAKAKPRRRRARAAAGLFGKVLAGLGACLLLYKLYQHTSAEGGTLSWKPLRKLETVTGATCDHTSPA